MHHIQRYSSLPVLKPENVAAHSWQVAFISMLIGWDLIHRGGDVQMGDLLEKALCHDLSEAMSGDIIRSYAYSSPQMTEAKREADYQMTTRLTGEFGEAGTPALLQWENAKNETDEGQIVALADVLTVVTYCVEERRMGSEELDLILKRAYEQVLKPRFQDHPFLWRYVKQMFPDGNYTDAYRRVHYHTSEFTEPEA
jgi:putative hydrolase of HD superfamily